MFTSRFMVSKVVKTVEMYTFLLNSIVWGYHEYKSLWTNPFNEEELICKREIGNPCDPQAVAMKKELSHVLQVVGHVPRRILPICSIFIRQGGLSNVQ